MIDAILKYPDLKYCDDGGDPRFAEANECVDDGIVSLGIDRPAPDLWAICCARSADFFLRQAAYIILKHRGYQMPLMLPVEGDELPHPRLRVVT